MRAVGSTDAGFLCQETQRGSYTTKASTGKQETRSEEHEYEKLCQIIAS